MTTFRADPKPPHAIVIGAGFGGLAMAIRLLARGYTVELFERHPDLGGRARCLEIDDTRFDAGPTVITAPFLFAELFDRLGERLEDSVELLPVEPFYRMEFADGSRFDYGGSISDTIAEIERIAPGEGDRYPSFYQAAEARYQRGFRDLATQPFTRLSDMLRVLPDLLRLRADQTVYDFVSQYFTDERLRRSFSVPSLLVGGNPYKTSSLYLLIHVLEREGRVWFPRGGTGALVIALADLFRRHGGMIRTDTPVSRLATSPGRIEGVVDETGRIHHADLVVSNVDPLHVYRHWLPATGLARIRNALRGKMKQSMGLFVVYFTTARRYPELEHHTILFGDAFREVLKDVFDRLRIPSDLSLYLHRPTATDPAMAPEGRDAFYVLTPVPNLRGKHDWDALAHDLTERILTVLETRLMPDLRSQLRATHAVSPRYFADELSSPDGAGFSIAPILTQSAGLRFHNQSPAYRNLYFVGAGTHPGAGVPGVVSSAAVVERLLDRELSKSPAPSALLGAR
jgi:phytoene desaturase